MFKETTSGFGWFYVIKVCKTVPEQKVWKYCGKKNNEKKI